MTIGKAWRLGGFVTALAASGALVAGATGATGAYFSETHTGTLSASTGGVHVSTSNLALNFTGLLPEDYATKSVSYTATGSAPEDIWLVFPSGEANVLNGQAGTPAGVDALGRFGHFAVTSPAGNFTSFNLAAEGTEDPHLGAVCTTDDWGHGGSTAEAANRSDFVPYCPVPSAILLSSNLAYGHSGTANITFGYTKLLTGPQDAPIANVANFEIVATQHGVLPNDPNNAS